MKTIGEYIIESATNSQKQFFCEQFSKAMTKLSSSAGYTRDLLQTMLNNLDMDVLKTSHRSKNTLLLSDVFIYPTLRKFVFDDDKNDEINADKLFADSIDGKFVFISGDDLSGKTSLIRKYITELRKKN